MRQSSTSLDTNGLPAELMQRVVILTLLLLCLIMSDQFTCPDCSEQFQSNRGLSRHRNGCAYKNSGRATTHTKVRKRERATDVTVEQNQSIPAALPESLPVAEPVAEAPIAPKPKPKPKSAVVPVPKPQPTALKPSQTGRVRFLPSKFQDNLPSLSKEVKLTFVPPDPLIQPKSPQIIPKPTPPSPEPARSPTPTDPILNYVNTEPDEFGVYRSYPKPPTSAPDTNIPIEDICEGHGFPCPPPKEPPPIFGKAATQLKDTLGPFPNVTVFRLMDWHYSRDTKSIGDLDDLVKNVFLPDDFSKSHLEGFSAKKVLQDIDDFGGFQYTLKAEDGWYEASVKLPLPAEGVKQSEAEAPLFEIPGVYFRKPLEVIKSVFQSEASQNFHYTPFRLYQQSPDADFPSPNDTRLHQELYNSDAYIEDAPTITHLKRELMHAVWALILDPEFMHAYEHGIKLKCGDGVERRLFPRFFTYSADYPENRLLGTVWDKKRRIQKPREDTGYHQNMIESIRRWIFDTGYSIASQAVEQFLQPYSWVPTRNIFSERFAKFGLNFYNLFVPDVLHELELGVWKALFTHLLRILFAIGGDSIQRMNKRLDRFRRVPPFGRDTIRRIQNNASAMKQMAARDFEDLLQISLPVFEGLVPDHEKDIQDLLFDMAALHCLAKFRLHSDTTLQMLDNATTELGRSLRKFEEKVCKSYGTKELPKETAARGRKKANAVEKEKGRSAKGKGKQKATGEEDETVTSPGARQRTFSLDTYKIHAIGYYATFIPRVGATDSYSTQIGELEHKRVKRFYARTNKTFRYVRQVTAHEKRKRIIEQLKNRQEAVKEDSIAVPFHHSDPLPPSSPHLRYKISADNSQWLNIPQWMNQHEDDPAVTNFYSKLRAHIFARLTKRPEDDTITWQDRSLVKIRHSRMYCHKVLRVHYTTYDMRRSLDSINPRTHSDVMVLSSNPKHDGHPYWYCCVLGIFHVNVSFNNQEVGQLDFLWVRWFDLDQKYKFGWKEKRLPRVCFVDGDEPSAFGFLDPAQVVRAVHLIPAFNLGKSKSNLEMSVARKNSDKGWDWAKYYVGINQPSPSFADRDMAACYIPDIRLGHMQLTKSLPLPEDDSSMDEVVEEEIVTEDVEMSEEPLILPEQPPAEGHVVAEEADDEGKQEDYGYVANDEEDEEDERDGDENEDLGPEDGEEPLNYDMEVLAAEGYGVL
ncbi:hypothetical protein D9758_013515 [Tetrapyrgos nigripes]|uniref:C2H2-type domain-containing protein n=1 Tax=Tetrapyrgos nigripes TaxID=182062 RepID=A0A8H5D0Q0_9AGAR|nr:hypothetical protein D9758_013515 [Tetrapyrgos nigripes]